MSADHLTPEQRTLISHYREKWQHIGLSIECINQQQAIDAVQAIYTTLELTSPTIIFVDSPNAAFEYIWNLLQASSDTMLGNAISSSDWSKIYNNLQSYLLARVPFELQSNLHSLLENHLANEYANLVQHQLENHWENVFYQHFGRRDRQILKNIFSSCRKPESLVAGSSYFDFCVHVLNYHQFQDTVITLEKFVRNCGWTFFFENVAIIANHPTKISINSENRIHAEDAAAIAFTDGYSLNVDHGQIKLERIHKLIDHINWTQLLKKFNAVEIDSWEEYSLLRVNERVNVQPMQFLKATNPSTGEVHVSKIPLRITSAIEAVRWVNQRKNPK
ncbi:MAG: hypothetical protein KME21_03165 [Desmonostoc vinosum HA7617-LM4]|jgi:hypothetical protein|nr:hypothetical protein [Desmonostoc vinosum HA7617-LM4]